jgi:hypothetical protein
MTNTQFEAVIAELRALRAVLERPRDVASHADEHVADVAANEPAPGKRAPRR